MYILVVVVVFSRQELPNITTAKVLGDMKKCVQKMSVQFHTTATLVNICPVKRLEWFPPTIFLIQHFSSSDRWLLGGA
jgi:hypothetical protein